MFLGLCGQIDQNVAEFIYYIYLNYKHKYQKM